jgi:hypothetical protein
VLETLLLPNFSISDMTGQELTLRTYIQEALGSYLGQDTDYPEIFSASPCKIPEQYLD